jgi:hypothetical protein
MNFDKATMEKIDTLHDMGRDFVERAQIHGGAVELQFDQCAFDRWRRKVNDLLYTIGGCEDLYYQRFSKEVVRPHVRDLEEGLRILSAVRDDVSGELAKSDGSRDGSARPSVSYH